MPRKSTPAKVMADRYATIVTVLGMLLAAAGQGPVRIIGIVAVIGAVVWYCTTGMYLEGSVDQDESKDQR